MPRRGRTAPSVVVVRPGTAVTAPDWVLFPNLPENVAVLYFVLALLAYFAVHSLLAAESVKRRVLARTGWSRATYRLCYNAIALAGFAGVMGLYWTLPAWPLWEDNRWTTIAGWLIILAGVAVIYLAMRPYDTAEFIGLRAPEHAAGLGNLSTDGLNAYVRHPLYFGTLLCLWGYLLETASGNALVLALVGTIYIYVGARLEERKLIAAFGEEYRRYRASTPMLIPGWR